MQIVIDGTMTNYQVDGSGDVVLLLHGWGDDLSTYDSITSALKDKYKVVRLDLPGFGKTETPKETYSLELFALFVQKLLHKLDIQDAYTVIGHSNGGAIAVKGLSTGMLNCRKLVLLASSGIRTDHNARKKILRLAAKSGKIITNFLPKNMQHKMKKKVYASIGSEIFVAENMQETFKRVVTEDVVSDSNKITADTLLIYGDKDTATPVRYGAAYAQHIKQSRLITVEGAGHFLHHTHSIEVESLITKFMDES